jgi:hypothetical protein
MACSVLAILDVAGYVDEDALAASFAAHHDFDRGYGSGVNRMLRLIRQEGADWRQLAAAAFDGRSCPRGRAGCPPGAVRDKIGYARDLLHLDDPRSAAAPLGNGLEISAADTVPFVGDRQAPFLVTER